MSEDQTVNSASVDQHEENKLVTLRREKLAELRQQGKAFPNKFRRDALTGDLQAEFKEHDKPSLEALAHPVKVAGRIMLNRGAFLELQDMSGRIQLYVNRKLLSAEELAGIKTWDLGDIVGVTGTLQRSGKGDLFVDMTGVELLAKSLRPLPEKHKGLTDIEQRCVDLITNKHSRDVFRTRSKIIQGIRDPSQCARYRYVSTYRS